MKEINNSEEFHYGIKSEYKRKRRIKRGRRTLLLNQKLNKFYRYSFNAVFIIVFILFIRAYVMQQVIVDGASMEATLSNEDRVVVEMISYRFSQPDHEDIVVFKPYDNSETLYVKRVIGIPGDTIHIKDGKVYVNGVSKNEKYTNEAFTFSGIASVPITLGDNEYFLLGDNRPVSLDSRDERVGVVKGNTIIGKAVADIWPIKNFKILVE